MARRKILGGLMLALLVAAPAAAGTTATFTLDGLSFVSFGDVENYALPPGSTITFQFGDPQPDGTVSFTIPSGGATIGDIALPTGTLRYTMPTGGSGQIRPTADRREIEFTATVRATVESPEVHGSFDYTVPFTTEQASASNLAQTDHVIVTGFRLLDGVWYAQIVGAVTNRENAYPRPGTAVYTVLSGTFDQVPE